MADLIFKCKYCNTSIPTDDSMCGDVTICVGCGNEIIIPIPGIEPGVEFGDFKLLTLLGSGASGEVWLAYQKKMEREVALKILNPNLAKNSNFMKRFKKEVVNSAKMNHPNIVTAYDSADEKGLSYLAITYVDGQTIETKLDEGIIFEEKDALEIIKQIAGALKYAWDEFHIVHRDIKPANIIVSKKGIPMLLDLGISKDTKSDMALTLTGTVVGTPYYMSPEQAVGDKSIDFRSDIYALGTTLYHMLTGKVPYHATTSMAIIMKHLNDNYEAPDKLNPQISENCCKLIAIMMAKNKPERHTCWQDLLTDIDRVLDDKAPLTAIPTKKSFSKSSVDVDGLEKKDNRYLLITFAIISVIIFITILILLFSSPEKTSSVKFSNLKTIPVVVKQNDDKNLSFRSVSSMLDKTKHSEQDISKNWETILGKKFSWRGAFVLYRERFLNDPEVRVAVPFCKLYKNFNLILVTPEKDKAMKFKPGQTLSFTGIPYKYQSKKNGAVVVYMKDVKFH